MGEGQGPLLSFTPQKGKCSNQPILIRKIIQGEMNALVFLNQKSQVFKG